MQRSAGNEFDRSIQSLGPRPLMRIVRPTQARSVMIKGEQLMLESLRGITPFLLILALGLFILFNNKRLARKDIERDRERRYRSFLRFQYDEGPLRVQIVVAGIILTTFGVVGLIALLTRNYKEIFERIIGVVFFGSVLIVLGAGLIAFVVMLTKTKNQ
jgi:hypothetical protein